MKTIDIYAGKNGAEGKVFASDSNGSTTNGLTSTVAALGFAALVLLAIIGVLV